MKAMENKMMSDAVKAGMYGITTKSVGNWEERAKAEGLVVPWSVPGEMVEWYVGCFGRNAPKKLRVRCGELGDQGAVISDRCAVDEADDGAGDDVAGVVVVDDAGKERVKDLEKFAEQMGLAATVARVVLEEDRSYKEYMTARARGEGVAGARKSWIDATEAKRALSKSDDAVELAAAVLKEWVRGEWDLTWREVKKNLGAGVMGKAVLDELALGEDVVDQGRFDRIWGKELERVLLGVEVS